MKLIAERMGHDAAANTHTFLNAVPQRSKFNSGIWLDLEYITTAWAQENDRIWIVTGPIYIDGIASGYIGEDDEFKVSIPDALYKIVVKENKKSPTPDVLAFIYPQVGAGYYSKHYDHKRYLTSVDEIELLTGLNFLSTLPDDVENHLEKLRAEKIWPYQKENIIDACKS
ncbi:Nuclease precursor [Pseudoalteromonas sp. P1-9]|nr:Nuclease precursor [Pseudoalteromonas sp. P1-9]